jgi:hypothetical protein
MILPILTLMLVFSGAKGGQSTYGWNGIVPLKSTKADVEKKIGDPMAWVVSKHSGTYKVEDGTVWVLYSTGLCEVDPKHGWNVPEFTVIRIYFEPNYPNPFKFSDIKTDSSKFERRRDPGSLHLVEYINRIDGIVLTVDTSDDSIRSFGYFPGSKDDSLKCKNLKANA